jgi:hypothetical protein
MSMAIQRGDAGGSGDVEVLVEVSAVGAGQGGDLRRGASLAPVSFASRADDVADALLEIARRMRGRLQSGDENGEAAEPAGAPGDGAATPVGKSWGLDEVQLSFQLALQADAGVVIAKASTSATFSATMTWRRT